jgi:uncharacterized DUF497 family protein
MPMEFDWDPAKDAANRRKHGVSFEQATEVFEDHSKVGWLCSYPEDEEERFIVIGRQGWRIVTVVYTLRGTTTRLISARKASRSERRAYDQSETYP